MKDDSDKFLEDVCRTLDTASEDLEGATLSRLNQARQRALTHRKLNNRKPSFGWRLVPVAGLLLLVVLVSRQPGSNLEPDLSAITDLQIITAEDSLDFYQEEIGFYEWLSEVMENENVHNGSGSSHTTASNTIFTGEGSRRRSTAEPRSDRVYWFI